MPVNEPVTLNREPDPAKRLRQSWGLKVRQVRELRGRSRAEIAGAIGVTESAVGMWERGETAPRAHHQMALADVLEVPHAVLFPMDAVA